MVVDDSVFMRRLISDILNEHEGIEVISTAQNGKIALENIEKFRPDVITLDVEMPEMDGIETLKVIKKKYQIPVIMISSLTKEGAKETLMALENGAIDFVTKPSGSVSLDIKKVSSEITSKVLLASKSRPMSLQPILPLKEFTARKKPKSDKIIVIGTSTGGPNALKNVVPLLPRDIPCPILIVQHMPPLFTATLASRLDKISMISVREAKEGDMLEDGLAYLAPGDYHMVLGPGGKRITLNQEPEVWGVRPAVDFTMAAAAKFYKENVISVIMTGMGHDGSNGAKAIKKAGGKCIVEHESTCVVYGMPKTIVDQGNADKIVPLNEIANAIVKEVYS